MTSPIIVIRPPNLNGRKELESAPYPPLIFLLKGTMYTLSLMQSRQRGYLKGSTVSYEDRPVSRSLDLTSSLDIVKVWAIPIEQLTKGKRKSKINLLGIFLPTKSPLGRFLPTDSSKPQKRAKKKKQRDNLI